MPPLTTKTELRREVLRRIAGARLQEFETLRTATPPHYTAAMYLGGYAVEALLKCAICDALNLEELPVAFHVHDLDVLLFFSGRHSAIQAHPDVWQSFTNIQANWSERLRYEEPLFLTKGRCDDMAVWLSDPLTGVVPWLEARL